MKSVKNEFPNPVLAAGRDDYITDCSFATNFDPNNIVVDTDNIIILISYTLVCNGLQSLINDGKATVIVNVRSSADSYSRLFRFPNKETQMEIKIPKYDVVKKIEISGSIIAVNPISNFQCEDEFDELYFGGQSFEIRKGDTLACEDSRIIYIDDSELEKPIASIFSITCVQNQEEDIDSVFDDPDGKIIIKLKPDLFRIYNEFKDYNNGTLRRYVTAVIVYPVLIEAINKIQLYRWSESDRDDSMAELRWFRAIEKKTEQIGFKLEDYQDSVTSLADKLLGNISLDALKSFKDTLESEMNNGEITVIGGVD